MTVKKQFHIVQLSTLLLRKKGVKVILFKKKNLICFHFVHFFKFYHLLSCIIGPGERSKGNPMSSTQNFCWHHSSMSLISLQACNTLYGFIAIFIHFYSETL